MRKRSVVRRLPGFPRPCGGTGLVEDRDLLEFERAVELEFSWAVRGKHEKQRCSYCRHSPDTPELGKGTTAPASGARLCDVLSSFLLWDVVEKGFVEREGEKKKTTHTTFNTNFYSGDKCRTR